MEALGTTFLGGLRGASSQPLGAHWTPKIVSVDPVANHDDQEGRSGGAFDESGPDALGPKSTTRPGTSGDESKGASPHISLIMDLFKPGSGRVLKLRDFRREFGGSDKKRLQSGIDQNELDLMYQDLFNLVDRDRKGYLNMDDFLYTLSKKLPKAQVEELRNTFRDGSGEAEAAEAKKLPPLSEDKVQEITELFNLYDTDGMGMLDFASFERVILETWEDKPTMQEIKHLFEEADASGKGYMNLADFVNWLQKTLWVDFMELSKGGSHGYCKFIGKSQVSKRARRGGMHETVINKTLIEISVKGNGSRTRSNFRPTFLENFIIQQTKATRLSELRGEIFGENGHAPRMSNTLNRPRGPLWRPPSVPSRPRSGLDASLPELPMSRSGTPMAVPRSRNGSVGRKGSALSNVSPFRRPQTSSSVSPDKSRDSRPSTGHLSRIAP